MESLLENSFHGMFFRHSQFNGELCSSFHAHSDRINKSMGECIDYGQGFIGVVVSALCIKSKVTVEICVKSVSV